MESITQSQTIILNRASTGRNQIIGYHRWLRNAKVNDTSLISALTQHCQQQVEGRDILCIQDTTEYNYQHRREGRLPDDALGPVGNNHDMGYFAHPTMAIDVDSGHSLGFSAMKVWTRDWDKADKYARKYKTLPVEQKESYRWISSAQQSKQVCARARSITFIADREADIFELHDRIPDEKTHVLIRSRGDRMLYGQQECLYAHIAAQPVLSSYEIEVPANNRKGRQKHQARLELKAVKVNIERPKRLSSSPAKPYVTMYAIEAKEHPDTIQAGQPPVHWVLLTTIAVTTEQQARSVIDKYSLRWQIEQLFRLTKSKGLNLEDSQLETARGLINLGLIALQVAIRILQLTQSRQQAEAIPATVAFTPKQVLLLKTLLGEYQGKTTKQQNPFKEGSLSWASWIIARIGGWKGYNSQALAGPLTFFRGYHDFMKMFELFEIISKNV